MLEKPIALELWEADELIMLAKRNNLKFTIGYSQRFNTKIAYAKKKITDGTLGKVVSVLVSRNLSRTLGKKIASRVRLSPVVMESTHDLDFVFWLLEPAKPVRVYSQGAYGYMEPVNGSHDVMFTTVTMDNGIVVMIGGGWNLPESLSELLRDLDRDHRHRRRAGARRHPARQLAQHRKRRPGIRDVHHAGRAGRRSVRRRHGAGDDPFPRSLHPRHARDGDAGKRAARDGDLYGGRSLGRPQRAGRSAADQRDDLGRWRNSSRKSARG